jgi:hypothetical protein
MLHGWSLKSSLYISSSSKREIKLLKKLLCEYSPSGYCVSSLMIDCSIFDGEANAAQMTEKGVESADSEKVNESGSEFLPI